MNFLKNFLQTCANVEKHTDTIAYLASLDHISKNYPIIANAILDELKSQRNSLKLIASENYSSLAVQLAMGNLLTDKYAEGHPGHRFYAGCEHVDTVESYAVDTAKSLFGAEHAYVQPHSGADANLVAFWSILIKRVETPAVEALGKKSVAALTPEEFETIRQEFSKQKLLGLALDCGGHLTHGSRVNLSSKMMKAVSYGVDPKTGLIDYKQVEEIAMREKPLILIAGYSSYPRLIDFAKMREIADRCGATLLVDMAHFAGLVAGKALVGNFDPVPFAHIVTSTTHKTLRGPRGGLILCKEEFKPFIDKGCPFALGGPLPHVMASKAISFKEALDPSFKAYAKQIIENAQTLAKRFKSKGVSLITDGTDNHLLLIDVQKNFGLNGRQAESLLSSLGCTVNRNSIPNDPNGAWYCSGIRIGTPALTTRGFKNEEMEKIADILYDVLKEAKPNGMAESVISENVRSRAKREIDELLQNKPLYPEIKTGDLVHV
ncbi:MAG: glycine hydroxymethyltransferase [Chlamydiae bacterium]|jgi:glycine hydroxymethyltransferase|nr:glycine hydroxymethyltransferase [Chlamydiota bacterium]